MQYNWQLFGHKKQLELLEKSIQAGSLSHSYIFSGPAQVGKRTAAGQLAKVLLCESATSCGACPQCRTFSAASNPDFIEIKQDETIKIEQVRHLIYQLNLKPYMAKYKVAVIDNAEDMTVESANALLKLMEEPKPYTIIILITANPYRLLPTILSRAQKISFGLVEDSEFESALPEQLKPQQKSVIMSLAAGRPGVALSISRDSEALENLQNLEAGYKNFMDADLTDRLILAANMAEEETPEIKNALQFWLASLERELVTKPTQALAHRIGSVARTRRLLDANVNTKLLLTHLMIDC